MASKTKRHGDNIVDAVKASRLCADSAVREYFHAWKGAQELVYALLQQQQTKMTWKELRDASRPGAWLADLVCTALCVEMGLIKRNAQFIAVGNDFYKEFGCSVMQLPNHFSDNNIGNIMEYLAWFAFEEQRYEWIVAVCFRAAMCFRAAKMRALGPVKPTSPTPQPNAVSSPGASGPESGPASMLGPAWRVEEDEDDWGDWLASGGPASGPGSTSVSAGANTDVKPTSPTPQPDAEKLQPDSAVSSPGADSNSMLQPKAGMLDLDSVRLGADAEAERPTTKRRDACRASRRPPSAAKKSRANQPDTKTAQRDSGKNRGDSFHETERRDLRAERTEALLQLRRGGRLHQQMADATIKDGSRTRNGCIKWGPRANALWNRWHAQTKALYMNYASGDLWKDYLRLKQAYQDQCVTATAKRFRLGPPRGF